MSLEGPPSDEIALADLLSDGLFVDGDWIETKDQDPAGEVRLIQLADIGDGTFRDRSSRFLTMSKAKQLRCTFLEPGDILVARMPEPLGRACLFPGVGQPAVTAVDVCILRPNPNRARPEWLVNAINSPAFRSSTQHFVRGTTRQRISRKNLGTLRLHVPETSRQDRLVDAVARVETKRSSALGHVDLARAKAQKYREAVLAAACSGRLTEDWRTEHAGENADSVLIDSRDAVAAARKAPLAWVEPTWLELPDEWRWAPMGDLALIRGGIQKQPKRAPKDNAYPYLRVANVLRGRLDLRELHEFELFDDELETYRLQPGDLLVVEGNGSAREIGRAAVWRGEVEKCVHQNHIIRVRCPVMDPEFAVLYWNSPIGSREIASLAVTSSGLYSLSTKKIAAVPVPVAPLGEQREIVRRARELLKAGEHISTRLDEASRVLSRAARAILAEASRDGTLAEVIPAVG